MAGATMHRYAIGMYVLLGATMVAYDAYVVVPVADLAGQPLSSDAYASIPYSGDYTACRRLHQILYHERVRVIDTYNDQVHIELPSIFYQLPGTTTRQSTFWTLKKYLVPIKKILGDTNKLPNPLPYQLWNTLPTQAIVTLTKPYYDPASKLFFSAGTQFVQADQDFAKKQTIVYFLDPKTHRIGQITLPTALCRATSDYPRQQRIDVFINLIRSWVNDSKGCIPYVWGGTSIGPATHTTARIFQHKRSGTWYDCASKSRSVKTGCDCSGLIFRAAQISGIPYFFKNSYTATCYLQSISKQRPLAAGDIIWVPGHVMIVADLNKNTLFEARSYEHGYGKLQEIPLERVFKDIRNYQDLLHAYEKKLPLYRMNNAGVIKDTFKEFKLLSLASAWDLTY